MSVRTYSPSVRVGNWNEDTQLEEDRLKDFLERKARGELLIQKSAAFSNTINQSIELSISRDRKVHYGDVVMLVNPASCALSASSGGASGSVCPAAATRSVAPSASTAFVITSVAGDQKGDPLTYGTPFALRLAASGCTDDAALFLHSDRATFQKCAKKSRHNELTLVTEVSNLTQWKVEAFNPQYRMEMTGMPVSANEKVIIAHQKTNQNLCVEYEYCLKTPFGSEMEMSCHTSLDSHKAEMECNHWCIQMSVPGESSSQASS